MYSYKKIMVFTTSTVSNCSEIDNFIDRSYHYSGAVRVNKSIPQAIIDSGAIDRIKGPEQTVLVYLFYTVITPEKLCDYPCMSINNSFYTGEMSVTDLDIDFTYAATFEISINKKLNDEYAEYKCKAIHRANKKDSRLNSRMYGENINEFCLVSWAPKYYDNWKNECEYPGIANRAEKLKFYADSIANQL